jgi:hypothetical protein
MNNQIQTTSITPTGAASVLDDELGELVKELDAAVLYTPWGEESALPGDAADSIRDLTVQLALRDVLLREAVDLLDHAALPWRDKRNRYTTGATKIRKALGVAAPNV